MAGWSLKWLYLSYYSTQKSDILGFMVKYTVVPVVGDLWFGQPLVLGYHNHWHGSFLTIKYLA